MSRAIPTGFLLNVSFALINRWTQGWSISGITRYSTGFPVTLYNSSDTSLIGTEGNGINNLAVDELDYTRRSAQSESQPAQWKALLQHLALQSCRPTTRLGATIANTIGNSGRRFFSGPGINNFDLTLQKKLEAHRIEILGLSCGGI